MHPLGINIDPFLASMLVGLVWPLIQAIFDQPVWTPARRRLIVLAAAVILSVVVWYAGAYPANWRLLITQAGVIAGCAQAAFTILKMVRINGVSLIDWAGILTPGGEEYEPRHAAGRQDASTQ